jgi:hypothetical protein
VEYSPKRVNVSSSVLRRTGEELRCRVTLGRWGTSAARSCILYRDRRVEVTKVRDPTFVEPDVGRRYISVNDSALMDLRECSAKLTSDPENVSEGHFPVFGLKGTAVITQLTPWKIFEHKVVGHGLKVEVIEGNDVVMCSCLP